MGDIQLSGKPIDSLLEKVLCMNILSSDYFRDLYRLKTYHEVIDEIYNQVDHVEPWMTGNCRGPSTAFCLLYKFFTMKLTAKQMHGLLKHPDSPYIRAVGFLYLRYAADPKTLWTWFEPYIQDDEEFSPGSSGKMTTMGVYVRDLLLGQYYFDTLFPRIPVTVVRQVVSHLEKMKLPTKSSGSIGENSRLGSEDTARRPPSVKAALSVSFGQRAPHRASTRDSSPVRRAVPPPPYDRGGSDDPRRSPSRHRSQSRDLSDREYFDRDVGKGRSRDQDRDRDRDRYRDRDFWDRDRDRERSHDRERDYDRERDRRRGYDRSRYSERDGSRRDRDDYDDYHSRRSRSRSRSKSRRSPSPVRTERFDHYSSTNSDKSKEKERTSASSNLAKLKDLYGDLGNQKGDASMERGYTKDSGAEEVIRLGGARWK
ncbi:pre-mRNA splicing factor SR-like 1 isoform X1 [Chenopodium quinoa]|uniref:pre-mRNA splicing factor SR-like 1 isoform X1 n=1 Tax=Chenopodium quinoa TaxID=63459 RepID=UPI000B786089|nr:pre-mRNA splicing factor SR-like 1 isoform X1 [Chenopodium quinoa]XP_021721100.1 pre-mRNA splicing factor SR-like 1 isoform X1 [Chenopodium quinoa]